MQVIRLDLDLIDPTANRPEIGQYIPNIIYINRETASQSGGGGGGRPDSAMAGAKNVGAVPAAMSKVEEIVKKMLG